MQKILFTKDECALILSSIGNSIAGTTYTLSNRNYKEWLIIDSDILNLILNKIKIFGVNNIKEGRVLKYEIGGLFDIHIDTYDKHPHRYKTVIIQLSDSDTYDGGELVIGNEVINKEIGNTVIFSGLTPHSMSVVKSGFRYSFVIWLERNDVVMHKEII
jgi:predicted 2-oxoglutarate/Fe(II)-dependent dioxygenase YbiX